MTKRNGTFRGAMTAGLAMLVLTLTPATGVLPAAAGERAEAPRGQDVERPRGDDPQVPRGDDVQRPRGDDVQRPRGGDRQG